MQTINLYQLAKTLEAYQNCIKSSNIEWQDKHKETIDKLLEALPHGSGIDAGIQFNWEKSTPTKLIFHFDFHFMDEHGSYDGWGSYRLLITPTFGHYNLDIMGSDKNDMHDYLYQLFDSVFTCFIPETKYSANRLDKASIWWTSLSSAEKAFLITEHCQGSVIPDKKGLILLAEKERIIDTID